jgi:hypothetical protein
METALTATKNQDSGSLVPQVRARFLGANLGCTVLRQGTGVGFSDAPRSATFPTIPAIPLPHLQLLPPTNGRREIGKQKPAATRRECCSTQVSVQRTDANPGHQAAGYWIPRDHSR